jgi:membrane protein implicated in regulation of membrane protease activity
MDWLAHNLAQVLLGAGLVSLIVDMVIFGFSTFILVFLGLSLVLTGTMMWLGIIPDTLSLALWSNAIVTAILVTLLWQPLKRWQNKKIEKTVAQDFATQQFIISDDVDDRGLTHYFFSGVKWKLKSRQPIPKNTLVEVTKVEVGVMWVQPCD